ncbi:FadR/GntR family transcriptional regulator [Nocardioides sp. LS1]|uniref:FadR/GntR family transcriptional regulator n=1 Tax=Nocardioides sp. LS1 TaxID=1027620 RepID=UPI000F61B3A6|nr:FCD domain-containing protein [Nocardioides sp. LS1]
MDEQNMIRANGARLRKPLQQIRIAESIAAELRTRILNADEGAVLPKQDELVAEFQVSYPSVREALRILETEGLITVRRGNVGGSQMLRPDASSAAYSLGLALQATKVRLSDLGDAVVRLEPQCAAMCVESADKDQVLPKLRQNLEETRALLDDDPHFLVKAREFHDLLVTSSGNRTTELIVRSLVALWSAQEEAVEEVMAARGEAYTRADRQVVVNAHAKIIARMEAGDASGAERAVRRHNEAIRDTYISRVDVNEIVDAACARARRSFQALV